MARDHDVAFPIKPGEVLEVIQILGNSRTPMLRLPSSAPPLQPIEPGKTRIDATGQTVTVVVASAIPSQRPGLSGELLLAVPVDLEPMKKRVADHAQEAQLVGLAVPIAFGAGPGTGGTKLTLPIPTDSHVTLQLEAIVAEPAPTTPGSPPRSASLGVARYACMGLAGLLLVGFFATSYRRSATPRG